MVCSICGQNGHNRRTCPQRNTTGLVNQINMPIQSRRILTRKFWKITIKAIIYFQRFVKVSLLLDNNRDDLKYAYFHWLKIKEFFKRSVTILSSLSFDTYIVGILNLDFTRFAIHLPTATATFQNTNQACLKFHKKKTQVKDNKKEIKLINLREENYLIYWVSGNLMVETLDIVLDLHEDITLDSVSEWYKDVAGVPSIFTNIT